MPADLAAMKCFTPEERAALELSFAHSHKPKKGGNQCRVLLKALTNPVIIACSIVKFSRDVVLYGVIYCERVKPAWVGGGSAV